MAFFDGHKTEEVTLENSALYESELGAGALVLECLQFEAELFKEAVSADITEYGMVQEGADVTAFVEGTFENVKTKVVEFFQKLWAKIKAVFNGFYAKISARLMSDNKAFYNKFKKKVEGKNLADLKIKYAKFKGFNFNPGDVSTWVTEANAEKNSEELKVEMISKITGVAVDHSSDIKAKVMEDAFGEETEVAYNSVASEIVTDMVGGKWLDDAKKAEKELNKAVTKSIADIKKANKETKNLTTITGAYASVVSTLAGLSVAVAKKRASQARKAFAKAVAFHEGAEFDADLIAVEADGLM